MTNSAEPDQLAFLQKPTDMDLHCLQRQGTAGPGLIHLQLALLRQNLVSQSYICQSRFKFLYIFFHLTHFISNYSYLKQI